MSTQQVNYLINVTGNLEAKLKKATKGFDKLDKEVTHLKKNVGKGNSGLSGAFKGLGGVIAGAFAVQQVVAFGKASVEAFDKQEQAVAQVRQGLISTGNTAGRTLEQLTTQASDLQKKTIFGDEEILQGATAQLLTFTNIAGEEFDRTQMAVLDLSTRLGTDLKSSAIQLGKALNDPVANLSALSRSGIQFTKEQKSTIKSLTETNRLAEAQALILTELEKQYGGSAEAAAKAGLGPFKQLQNAFGDFQERLGKNIVQIGTKLIPILTKLTADLDGLMEAVKDAFSPLNEFLDLNEQLASSLGVSSDRVNILTIAFKSLFGPVKQILQAILLIPKLILKVVLAFRNFVGEWENIPIILDAAWESFKDFNNNLISLVTNTGKSLFNILKESLDIGKIISGDTSGISRAAQDAVLQINKDVGAIDLKANFDKRVASAIRANALGKDKKTIGGPATALNASSAAALGGTGTTDLAKVSDEVTGTKATNINLNIEKLIENLNFNTSSLTETTGKIKEEVTRVLIEALRDTTAIATN